MKMKMKKIRRKREEEEEEEGYLSGKKGKNKATLKTLLNTIIRNPSETIL
jgi:hypothetical protein